MSEVISVRIPQETVNDDQVLIQQWQVVDGQAVQVGQVLVEVETSKSVFEVTSPADGFIRLNAASDEEVPIGKVLCYIGASVEVVDASLGSTPVAAHPPANGAVSTASSSTWVSPPSQVAVPVVPQFSPLDDDPVQFAQTTRFSQQALALLVQHHLPQSDFAGRGLVRAQDVLSHLNGTVPATPITERIAPAAPSPEPLASPPKMPSVFRSATGVPFRTEPLARSKRIETKMLSWSTQQAIRSSVTVMVPTVGRNQLLDQDPEAADTLTAGIIRACAQLLREYPSLNACCLDDQVLIYESVHIGYALDAGHGLKVAVLRDVDQKTVPALIADRQRLIAAYLDDGLLPADLSGATFTVSDLSGSGVTTFDPLISEGQAGILGISGEFALGAGRRAYHLVLSFDHRLVEGRAAAMFLDQLKDQVVAIEQSLIAQAASPASVAEPSCARCGVSYSAAAKRNHFLVSVAGSQKSTQLVCTICLQGR